MDFPSNGNEPERPLTRREMRERERLRQLQQAQEDEAAQSAPDNDSRADQPRNDAPLADKPLAEESLTDEPLTEQSAPEEPTAEAARSRRPAESNAAVTGSAAPEQSDPFADILGESAPARDTDGSLISDDHKPRKKRRGWGCLIVVLVLVAALVGAGMVAWNAFGDRITDIFDTQEDDYEGTGNGTEVNFTILPGDTGTDIGLRLQEEGIVMTSEAFVRSIMAQPEEPTFIPGTYVMQEEMSAASALVTLTDEENRVQNSVTIPEGTIMRDVFTLIESDIGIPATDLEAAAEDPQAYGLPEEAESLEGFLFPATYNFTPDDTAEDVITTMVERTYESLGEHGVPEEDVWDVIRLASLIEKEARFEEDFYKVSRVFLNRIDIDMLLQSDATVTYGTGEYDRAATTDTERNDASNEYNTYQHSGMVIRPISNPGDTAIDAAMNPAEGPWLFFVTVNLETGETVFTETYAEHQEAVDDWLRWLEENPEYG
ncbi:MAG: endolytic transglycosylase MltG [Gulosibacter sp.]|uniref:endolytic transglycosylase MltG n=1 Tax=Gulosibacter sp. TaxID=2817531 RepID=UPI003F8DDA7C